MLISVKTISIFVFNKKSFFSSIAIHTILLVYAFNYINYKINLKLQNNNIVEVQLFSQSNKKKNINPENKTLLNKKEVLPKVVSKTLDYLKENEKKINSDNKPSSSLKTQKTLEKIDNTKNEILKNPSVNNKNKKSSKEAKSSAYTLEQKKSDLKLLKNYKVYLKNRIQKEASANYPRTSIARREEGNVEIVFSLDKEGVVKEVSVGSNTNASSRIIDSLTKVLKNKIVKFEENEILKKINTFSIIIVYKLK